MTGKNIAIIGTMDTKAAEARYLSEQIGGNGHQPILIDVGPLTETDTGKSFDYSNHDVAAEAGWRLEELIKTGRRDEIMSTMGKGAASILSDLLKRRKLHGAIGIGGNQGSAIASIAMWGLPIGFPKLLVSTVASGNIRPYVGHTDMAVMFSVADLVGGPNLVTRRILSNAASAVVGMVDQKKHNSHCRSDRAIALSAMGNTELAADRINQTLKKAGFQVITFHASGAGGTAMETLIEEGMFEGIIDLTPHELTEEVVGLGAYVPVKPGRMTAAGNAGIPQIVSTGALEYLCFGPKNTIPSKLKNRSTYFHNPYNANVKATRREMEQVGEVMAARLNAAKGPTEVMIPLKGWSIYGSKGGPLHDQQGNNRLLKALNENLNPKIRLIETDLHINDPEFADLCVERLIALLHGE